jgi:predicted P-loop ATPase
VPLAEPVDAEAYEAIARKIAEVIGIDLFDDSTYQPTRLMYWPSHSADVEPVFESFDAEWLRPSDVLGLYRDWTDLAEWPMSSRETEKPRKLADRQGDPTEKKGIVGAFCRTYTVTEALTALLPGVYTPTASPDRWTYAAGSTAGGLVIYDGDRFAYSNHATDPAGGLLCNAFDLVRIHRFGDLDEGSEGKSGKALPSYRAMAELAEDDPLVRKTVVQERQADFDDDDDAADWQTRIRISDRGVVADAWNAELIIENDSRLSGIRYNEMSRRIEAAGMPWKRPDGPWRDADDAQLYQWIVRTYDVQFPKEKFNTALTAVADRRRFHPVREWLDALPEWDGTGRVDTLLIDLLGAEDNVYTREATRCCLTAAVARIYEPGIKFDNVLILQGPQAIGKSFLFDRLGGDWYSDNLSVSDMRDKAGAEKLQGYWILELSELAGMRKAEVEGVKGFISRREDIYRAAYGRNTEVRPRQCVIVGSTNDDTGFLRDITGNRRFWPVRVTGETERHPWDLTDDDVRQIWAEAKISYQLGESRLLSPEAAAIAEAAQTAAMEADDRQGIVEEYLARKLPEGWEDMDSDQRQMFLDSEEEGTQERREVSNIEIWTEALHNPAKDMEPKDTRAITAMMLRIPGWERTDYSKRVAGYGRQRIWRRLERGTKGTEVLATF